MVPVRNVEVDDAVAATAAGWLGRGLALGDAVDRLHIWSLVWSIGCAKFENMVYAAEADAYAEAVRGGGVGE